MKDPLTTKRIKFGAFEADLDARELRRNKTKIPLQDQPFQVLALLLENPGQIVLREDFRAKIWPANTFVDFDMALNTAVRKIREALGDNAEHPRFVETLPRRGYRFLDTSVAERNAAIQSIAVLPLENLSGDPEQEYFADGLTEALIATLAKVKALRVISRTTAMHYKGVHRPLTEIAGELQVDAIVEGTVARSGGEVRISAQLIEASTDTHLWAETYRRDLRDVLSLQGDVASAIVREIQIQLTPGERALLRPTRQVDADAYEFYLKGRFHWNKRTLHGLTKGAEYFQKAVDSDPTYAAAYAGLADSASRLGFWIDTEPEKACLLGKAAALKAIELDPSLSEAYSALCFSIVHYDFHIIEAEAACKRALELDPQNAFGVQASAICLMVRGRAEEALAEMLRAARLEPLSLAIQWSLSVFFWMARQYDRAIAQTQKILEIDPRTAAVRWVLALSLTQQRKFVEASEETRKAVEISGSNPFYLGTQGYVYAAAGRREEALAVMRELEKLSKHRHVSPHWFGLIYAGLNEIDEAFLWLERAHQQRAPWLAYAKSMPWFDNLRSDPRFYTLLQRMGIPI